MMLEWKDGSCAGLPAGWVARTSPGDATDDCDGWVWCVWRRLLVSNRPASHRGWAPTERAAQLACEAALLRLGVIPLPEWYTPYPEGSTCRDLVIRPLTPWSAVVTESGGLAPNVGWSVHRDCSPTVIAEGVCSDWAQAKAAAELHLRAELAAWLDALAAKEGAL